MREKRIHKKKMTKFGKRVSLFVVALVAFIGTTIFAFAVGEPTFTATADKSEYNIGDTVTITVSSSNMDSINNAKSYASWLKYDKDSFEYESYDIKELNVKKTKAFTNMLSDDDAENKGNGIYYMYQRQSGNDYLKFNGILYTLQFKVLSNAKGGDHEFNFSAVKYDDDNKEHDIANKGVTVKVIKPVDASSIKLDSYDNKYTVDLKDKTDKKIGVSYLPTDATDSNITYKPNDPTIVDVNSDGTLVPKKVGTTDVTVTAFGKELTANVTVTNHTTGISLDDKDKEISIKKGETHKLSPVVTPSDSEDKVTYTVTSGKDKVTVDADGTIHANNGGDATIEVKSYNSTVYCIVHVGVPLESISIDSKDFTLTTDKNGIDKKQLTATVLPKDATVSTNVTWSSNNENVAKVDTNGLVTLAGKGDAKITAIAGTGNNVVSASVNVHVDVPIESFTAEKNEVSLYPGENTTVNTTITPDKNITSDDTTITWTSADSTIATVDKATGKIFAQKGGAGKSTTITGKLNNGKSVSIKVNVFVPISKITLSEADGNTIDKYVKDKTKLTVTYEPESPQAKDIEWTTSDSSIATVDNGTIIPHKTGDVKITATLKANKEVTASRTLKIVASLQDIKINNIKDGKVEIIKDKTFTPDVTITPSDTTDDKTITWSVVAGDAVTVDSKTGVVTAVKGGNATIKGENAKKTITYTVSVVVPIDKVTIDKTGITNNTVTLNKTKNETYKVSAKIGPQDNTEADNTIKFDSSNKNVAIVSNDGVVTPISGGTTTITACAGKNKVKDSITINVIVPMESISLNKSETTINRKSTEKLIASINPLDTTDSKDITWTSSDPKVATVDKNGVVTGVSKGTAVITASALNGKFTATTTVTVKLVYIDKITGDDISLVAGKNDDVTKHISISPENATETEDINYETDDPSVAYVTPDGKLVTGVSEGVANVTVTTSNDKTTTLKVTVKNSLNAKLVTSQKDSLSYLIDDGAVYNMTDITSKDIDEVRLYASSIDDTVTDSDEYLVKSKLGENDKVVGYLDLGLYLLNKKSIVGAATELSNDVKVTIDVPEELIKSGRKFSIIRVHDGGADKLIDLDSDDSTITFETNKFSTYAIVYEAEKENATTVESNTNTKNPFTSNDVLKYVIALLSSLLVGGASVYALKKAK